MAINWDTLAAIGTTQIISTVITFYTIKFLTEAHKIGNGTKKEGKEKDK
jgi:hypothetical protein